MAATETRTVRIVVDASDATRGQAKANKALKRIERQSRRTADAVESVKRRLGGLAAAAASFVGFRELSRGVDELQNVRNRLRTVTDSQEELNKAWNNTLKVANSTRSSFQATATLYTRLARATEQWGISQDKALLVTERVNKALAASGASAAEAESTILQLSQAFQSGRLQGEEFRAIAENAPAILKAVSRATGIARKDIKKAASEGRVDIMALVDALTLYGDEIDKTFGQTSATVGQNLTILRNNLVNVLNNLERSTGVFDKAAKAVGWFAENLDVVAVALGALAVTYIPRAIAAIKALTVAMASNPIGAAAVALAAAATAIYANWDSIASFFRRLFLQTLPNAFDKGQIAAWEFADRFNESFNTIGRFAAKTVNFVLQGVDKLLGGIEQRLNSFTSGINRITRKINELTGADLGSIGKIELGTVGKVQAPELTDQDIQGKVQAARDRIAKRNSMDFSGGAGGGGKDPLADFKYSADLVAQAEAQLSRERAKAKRQAEQRAAKEAELRDELNALRAELDPTFAAQQKLAAAKEKINQALQAEIINQDQATRLIERARKAYLDQGSALDELREKFEGVRSSLDPVYAAQQKFLEQEKLINKALEEGLVKRKEANRLLKLAKEQRKEAAQTQEKDNKATQKGIQINKQFGETIGSSFEEAVFAGKGLREVVQGLITDLARLIFRKYVTSQIANLVGGLNLFGGGATASAKGNVFQGGRHVKKYAQGGVVSRPTAFPMRGGGTGLMGEAGPESIMPLKRDKRGRLGVIVAGGGGGGNTLVISPTINVNAEGGDNAQNRDLAQEVSKEVTPALRAMVANEMRKQMRPGGLFNNTTMRRG